MEAADLVRAIDMVRPYAGRSEILLDAEVGRLHVVADAGDRLATCPVPAVCTGPRVVLILPVAAVDEIRDALRRHPPSEPRSDHWMDRAVQADRIVFEPRESSVVLMSERRGAAGELPARVNPSGGYSPAYLIRTVRGASNAADGIPVAEDIDRAYVRLLPTRDGTLREIAVLACMMDGSVLLELDEQPGSLFRYGVDRAHLREALAACGADPVIDIGANYHPLLVHSRATPEAFYLINPYYPLPS